MKLLLKPATKHPFSTIGEHLHIRHTNTHTHTHTQAALCDFIITALPLWDILGAYCLGAEASVVSASLQHASRSTSTSQCLNSPETPDTRVIKQQWTLFFFSSQLHTASLLFSVFSLIPPPPKAAWPSRPVITGYIKAIYHLISQETSAGTLRDSR